MNDFPGKIAVLGGGSWATALAKLLLNNSKRIAWYIHRQDRIDDFVRMHHNPAYLTDVQFDVNRIDFSSDINSVCAECDTILLAVPSPYVKENLQNITADLSNKRIVSAVKGIVPGDNLIVTDYIEKQLEVPYDQMLVIGGPCHAEEVAMDRLSYLTIGCTDKLSAEIFAGHISGRNLKTVVSTDTVGIEYAAVLKNIYAIASGMVHGLRSGDNFLAMLVSNAVKEAERFVAAATKTTDRDFTDSVYLGDLLVTCYSQFSRNHNFGSLIGQGYSVKAAKMEMEMVVEGYYATKCMHEINESVGVYMPILDEMYQILYKRKSPARAVAAMAESFS